MPLATISPEIILSCITGSSQSKEKKYWLHFSTCKTT